ncbi:hypothetical protein LEN26_001673 [Aphanomyces euteiches]|nr:hypothetical protein AeMF1_018633 [Aphanomyces euteiches]KAH9160891.1 hypothetical protein LEN26_001673 [Aphanomyces euteiches]KAH9194421.1 hypothetical protein AeNC1_003602 [Aphanomyces euteiches]
MLDSIDDIPLILVVQATLGYGGQTGSYLSWKIVNEKVTSKTFELVDETTAIKVSTSGQYELTLRYCTLDKESLPLKYEVYLDSRCIHSYNLPNSHVEETASLSILRNSILRLYVVACHDYSYRTLRWTVKKI